MCLLKQTERKRVCIVICLLARSLKIVCVSLFHCLLARSPGCKRSPGVFPPSRSIPSSVHTPRAGGSSPLVWDTAWYYITTAPRALQVVQQSLQHTELPRAAHRLKQRLQKKLAIPGFASQTVELGNQSKQKLRRHFVVFLMPTRPRSLHCSAPAARSRTAKPADSRT